MTKTFMTKLFLEKSLEYARESYCSI